MRIICLFLLFLQISYANSIHKFTDTSLDHLLRENHTGIILVWSPLMPLSILARDEIKDIGEEIGVSVTILSDPFSSDGLDDILASNELFELSVLNHFPAIVLYKDGKLIPWILQGYEQKESLKNILTNKLDL